MASQTPRVFAAAIASILLGASWVPCYAGQSALFQQRLAEFKRHCEALYADRALDPIRDKVALFDSNKQTFAMRVNTQYPTAAEKHAIAIWAEKNEECYQFGAGLRGMMAPQVAAIYGAEHKASESEVAALYLGKLTYGEFTAKRDVVVAEANKAVADVLYRLSVEGRQASLQAAQIANQAVANLNARQQTEAIEQMRMQMNQPQNRTFTCQKNWNITTCH